MALTFTIVEITQFQVFKEQESTGKDGKCSHAITLTEIATCNLRLQVPLFSPHL